MFRLTGRVVLFVFFFALLLLPRLFAQELYLRGTVVVAGQGDTLGKVSLVGGESSSPEVTRLLATPIPVLAEHPAIVPARDLRGRLHDRIGAPLVLVGGPLVYLPGSVTGSDREFYAALLQHIEKRLPDRSLRVEIWARGNESPNLSGIHGRLIFQFPAGSNSAQALSSNRYVEYRGTDNATFRYLPVHVRIEALVPVAQRDIRFGRKLSAADVGYVTKNVNTLSGRAAGVSNGLFRAASNISKGDVIYSYMVAKVEAITAGKQIRIAFRRGNVEVTVPGSAYQSGGLGDTISVAPSSTGTQYQGTIVSPTEVVVED